MNQSLSRTWALSRMWRRASLVSCGVVALSALTIGSARAQTPAAPASPQTPTTVTVLPNAQVAEAFKKVLGPAVLVTGEYKIMMAHRDTGGGSEVHEWDTDIFYVVDGSAVLVTGGTVTEGKTTAPGEIRGAGLANGESRPVTKGDVVVIPRGVPHWFKDVSQAPFLYFVVKTTVAH